MSLKTFHIIFITVTTLLCVFLAVWGFKLAPAYLYDSAKKVGYLGVIGSLLMPIYGVYFYQKVKKLSL